MGEKIGKAGGVHRGYEVFNVPPGWPEQESSKLAGMIERLQLGLNYQPASFLHTNDWHELDNEDELNSEIGSEPTFTLLAVKHAVVSAINDEFPGEELRPAVARRGDGQDAVPLVGLLPREHMLGSIILYGQREGQEDESVRGAVPALPLDHNVMMAGKAHSDTEGQIFHSVITVFPPEPCTYANLGLLVGRNNFALPGIQHSVVQNFKLTPHIREWARVSATPIL